MARCDLRVRLEGEQVAGVGVLGVEEQVGELANHAHVGVAPLAGGALGGVAVVVDGGGYKGGGEHTSCQPHCSRGKKDVPTGGHSGFRLTESGNDDETGVTIILIRGDERPVLARLEKVWF